MGRPETSLCVPTEETFYSENEAVPEDSKLPLVTQEGGHLSPADPQQQPTLSPADHQQQENQLVPDLSMSVSLSFQGFSMSCQDQLSVIQPLPRRTTSYEEIVHKETIVNITGCGALTRLLTTLTEWLVILQGVAEDRECDRPNVKCRCCKARSILGELGLLGTKLCNAEQIYERVGMVSDDDIQDISDLVQKIAILLRSEVSILIPTSIGRADPMVVEQARWLVQGNDSKNCASESVEGVSSLVTRLLGVKTCHACHKPKDSNLVDASCEGLGVPPGDSGGGSTEETKDGDIDMDILTLVTDWCSGYPLQPKPIDQPREEDLRLIEQGKQVFEKSRKRKQSRPVRVPSPSTNRKARKVEILTPEVEPNILTLLERKKKGVKKDGLYKFVLWREALKDEKSKLYD